MRKPRPAYAMAPPAHFVRQPHTNPASHPFGAWKNPIFSVPYAVRRLEAAEALQFSLIQSIWPQ